MSVRTWFTLSAAVLVALVMAFGWRFFSPTDAPEIIMRSEERITGTHLASCWPQRDGENRCLQDERNGGSVAKIPRSGNLRFIVTYPVQPEDGEILIHRNGDPAVVSTWQEEVGYDLDPGLYTVTAEARYPEGAYIRYAFEIEVN